MRIRLGLLLLSLALVGCRPGAIPFLAPSPTILYAPTITATLPLPIPSPPTSTPPAPRAAATVAPASLSTAVAPILAPTPALSSPPASKYELVDDDCLHGQCLFVGPDHFPIGVAVLEGYFTQAEQTAWGEKKLCDRLVIVGGSELLIRTYLSRIDQGNTVNSKNQLNQPVINIDLSGLSEAERKKLTTSTPQNPISLLVLSLHDPKATEVGACYSFVEILQVIGAKAAPAIPLQQLRWQGTTLWAKLKNQDRSVLLYYPNNWYLDPNSDASHIAVQNVPPFNNPSHLPGGLPEGFGKFSFTIDPNANPNARQGEKVAIGDVTWYRQVASGGTAGDRTATLETVHNGLVYRIQTYIAYTGGKGPFFDYQAAILEQMTARFGIQP